MPLPKYASIPRRNFAYSIGTSANFNNFNFSNKPSPISNYARTPGRDFKDFYYSTAASSATPQRRSFSGHIRRKPLPEEMNLECTLEELFLGCVKELKFTRDVVGKYGFARMIQCFYEHTSFRYSFLFFITIGRSPRSRKQKPSE